MKEQLVGLLDCNNFFVSCERLFRPDLNNKPVIVLSSNDGCVVARSKEVKDMGIPMGVPYFKIKDIIKKEGIVTFSSHLSLYRDISRRVFLVMREELDLIEQYSVDEAFFRVDGNPNEVAERLKKAIETRVGIPVSIGISDTKTKAKYANSIAKTEGGVCVINDKLWSLFIPSLNLSKIWGVGNQMELRYKRHGLKTVGDFVALDRSRVVSLFGLNGLRLYEELGFNGVFELAAKAKPQQSILSSRSFETEIYDVEVLSDAVAFHVRQVAADLRKMDMETINIRVFLGTNRFGDFLLRGGSKEAILVTSTSDTLGLLGEANKLLEAIYESGVPYKKAGVSLSGLKPANRGQASLFTEYTAKEAPVLMGVIDALNFKADRELILIGSRLKNKVWRTRNYSASPSYTTEWKDIVRVKAD